MYKWYTRAIVAGVAGMVLSLTAHAVDVKLTEELDYIEVRHQGKMVRVERIQDPSHTVDPAWAKTSRKCPPFCIQPRIPAEGVNFVGEYEVIDFMLNKVNTGEGMIIDARLPSWFKKGTIPGSVNIPFTVFEHSPEHEEVVKALVTMGGKRREKVGSMMRGIEKQMAKVGIFDADKKTGFWDFTSAKDVLLWCNGPWCGQSPHAIRALIDLGYPSEKIHYYRGGMQAWEVLGLTTIVP